MHPKCTEVGFSLMEKDEVLWTHSGNDQCLLFITEVLRPAWCWFLPGILSVCHGANCEILLNINMSVKQTYKVGNGVSDTIIILLEPAGLKYYFWIQAQQSNHTKCNGVLN